MGVKAAAHLRRPNVQPPSPGQSIVKYVQSPFEYLKAKRNVRNGYSWATAHIRAAQKYRKIRNVRNRYSCAPEQLRTSVLRREIQKMRNMRNRYGCATEQLRTARSLLRKTIQKNACIPDLPCPMSPLTDRFLKYCGDETILLLHRLPGRRMCTAGDHHPWVETSW